MNLLVVTHSYYPAFSLGGPSKSIHLINKYLVKNGLNVTVIATNTGLTENPGIKFNTWIDLDGVRIKYFNTYGTKLYNISPKMIQGIYNIIDKMDLVHITPVWNFPCIISGIICSIKKKKYIISPRGTLNRESFEINNKKFKKIFYSLIAGPVVRCSSAMHFTTQDEKENVIDYLKLDKTFFVIPNGLDTTEYNAHFQTGSFRESKHIPGDKRIILFLGRIHKKKGIDILINSFEKLTHVLSDIVLVISGYDNDGYQKELIEMVNNLNINNLVFFTGPLEGNEIYAAFKDSDCFVLPSYSENFGMSVVEAMAAGCPVIVSDRVGVCDYITEFNAGMVVKPDKESLFEGLKKVLSDQQLCNRYSERGKIMVTEKFEIDKISREFISKYQSIIQ